MKKMACICQILKESFSNLPEFYDKFQYIAKNIGGFCIWFIAKSGEILICMITILGYIIKKNLDLTNHNFTQAMNIFSLSSKKGEYQLSLELRKKSCSHSDLPNFDVECPKHKVHVA
jgi:hypothetical protein